MSEREDVSGWGPSYGDLFEDWEVAFARKLISEFLSKHSWLKGLEANDLLQECLTHWYLAKVSYRLGKGTSIKTYLAKVIKHKLQNILEEQITDKRKASHLSVSLDEPVGEGELSLEDVIPADTSSQSNVSLQIDLERALTKLTSFQRKLCDLLRDGYSVTEISQILGKSRSTIYDEIAQIRKVFSDEELLEYLE